MIPQAIVIGLQVRLFAFGRATVRKIYMHPKTREMCCDVKADSGELMHLSMKYVSKLLAG